MSSVLQQNKVCIFPVTALYIVHPFFVDGGIEFDSTSNTTKAIRALPLSSWFPFDEQDHYVLSFTLQVLYGCTGASYVSYTEIFTFSLIIFPLGQIKSLNYILSNFQEYVLKVKHQLCCSSEEAGFITLRELILQHKEIIR